MAESRLVDEYMHALGHAIDAQNAAIGAATALSVIDADELARIGDSVAPLSTAVVGMLNARVFELGGVFPPDDTD